MNLLQELPAIGTFLGGPAGTLAGAGIEFLAQKFGASAPTIDAVKAAIANVPPEQLLQSKQMDIDFQKFCLDNGIKLNLAQLQVNANEAISTNWWVAGWRPYIGWICGTGLAYQFLFFPIANGIIGISRFPSLDVGTLSSLLCSHHLG